MKKIIFASMLLSMMGSANAIVLKEKTLYTQAGMETVLVLENGMTIYEFDPDLGMPTSTCNATCAEVWPPVLITAQEAAQITQPKLGTVKRGNGLIQLTYLGRPVYTYFGDRVLGDAKGDGLGTVWHVVRP